MTASHTTRVVKTEETLEPIHAGGERAAEGDANFNNKLAGSYTVSNTRERFLGAKYFLERMIENQAERDPFKYNLSAFLSEARSVTLIMQKEYNEIPGFANWYSIQKEMMISDYKMNMLDAKCDVDINQEPVRPYALVDVRITEEPISVSDSVSWQVIRADGTVESSKSTPPSPPPSPPPASAESAVQVQRHWYFNEIPDTDVITICREHISKLESILIECERLFSS